MSLSRLYPALHARLTQPRDAAQAIPYFLLAILTRLGIGAIFLFSGMAKVDDFTVTSGTIYLFTHEYRLPFLPPLWAAHMAAYAEHVFSVLLFLGLATRLSALALLVMTAVIQIFVYPDAWPSHALWAAALLLLISRGPGWLSLDHWIWCWAKR